MLPQRSSGRPTTTTSSTCGCRDRTSSISAGLTFKDILSLHPQVEEVVVVGLPDERWGSIVAAFVKTRTTIDEKELDRHCLERELARFKRPRHYVFVDEIPKSPVGKILRRVLREQDAPPVTNLSTQ